MKPIDYKNELEKQIGPDGVFDVGADPAAVTQTESVNGAAKASCGPACDCNAPLPRSPIRFAIAIGVLFAATAIFAVKVIGKSETSARDDRPSAVVSSGTSAVLNAATPLTSLLDLNAIAAQLDAVFVMVLAGNDHASDEGIALAVETAARKLSAREMVVGVYSLSQRSPDYRTLVGRHTLPGVIVFAGGGDKAMVSVENMDAGMLTGEITESKLLQAFVAASMGISGGGCNCSKGASCAGS